MENNQNLIQVGDTNIWYNPVTGVNYMKSDKCDNAMSPMIDRTGRPIIDFHKDNNK